MFPFCTLEIEEELVVIEVGVEAKTEVKAEAEVKAKAVKIFCDIISIFLKKLVF